jgi:hypothetical protein
MWMWIEGQLMEIESPNRVDKIMVTVGLAATVSDYSVDQGERRAL